ncbi:MAG: signal peptidase I [Clostridia bacterium]|nr:signal peptidase I [Clostridia bacterium]
MRYDIESIEKRKNTSRTFKRILHIILIILIYNIVLLFFSSLNRIHDYSLFGYKAYVITTNSMEPSIKEGDAILTKKPKENDLKEGDVITFDRDNKSITHRIIRVDQENNTSYYVTKGDNNNVEDKEKITYDQVDGKEIMVLPRLGYVMDAAENQIVVLIITLVVLILLFARIQLDEKKYNRRVKKKNEAKEKDIL